MGRLALLHRTRMPLLQVRPNVATIEEEVEAKNLTFQTTSHLNRR